MQSDTTPLPLRHDTLLGVCEGLGRATGVSSTIYRIVFSALLLWNPEVVVIAYLGLGLVLLLVHWLVRDVRVPAAQPQAIEADNSDEETALAA